jgi:hypothetical protein
VLTKLVNRWLKSRIDDLMPWAHAKIPTRKLVNVGAEQRLRSAGDVQRICGHLSGYAYGYFSKLAIRGRQPSTTNLLVLPKKMQVSSP